MLNLNNKTLQSLVQEFAELHTNTIGGEPNTAIVNAILAYAARDNFEHSEQVDEFLVDVFSILFKGEKVSDDIFVPIDIFVHSIMSSDIDCVKRIMSGSCPLEFNVAGYKTLFTFYALLTKATELEQGLELYCNDLTITVI